MQPKQGQALSCTMQSCLENIVGGLWQIGGALKLFKKALLGCQRVAPLLLAAYLGTCLSPFLHKFGYHEYRNLESWSLAVSGPRKT